MSAKAVWTVFVVLILALGAWWALYPRLQVPPAVQSQTSQTQEQPAGPAVDNRYAPPPKLAVHHTVANGANVYSGSLSIRSCNTFTSGLSSSGSSPVHLQLNFTVRDGTGSCLDSTAAQDVPQPFSLSYSSEISSKTPVLDSVTVNGTAVPFTLVEGK